MNKIKKLFQRIYIGNIDSNILRQIVAEDCVNSNYRSLTVFSIVAAFSVFAMLMLTFFDPSVQQHRIVYLLGTVASLLILLASRIVYRRCPRWIIVLVYAAVSVFMCYGIALGTYTDPKMQSTTFLVLMIFIPLLFIERPERMALLIAGFDILFIILVMQVKEGAVRSADLTDAVIFGLLSVISMYYMMYIKYQRFANERHMLYAATTDPMTGLKNRTSYEAELEMQSQRCRESLAVLYIDVDALHELNNTAGHEAGDRMLSFVGETLKTAFGRDNTYRIGGDEFVVFLADSPEASIWDELGAVRRKITGAGYSVSCGTQIQKKEQLNISLLLKEAEDMMYDDKAKHYAELGRDFRGMKL